MKIKIYFEIKKKKYDFKEIKDYMFDWTVAICVENYVF